MNITLSIYQRILFEDLRPWLQENQSDNKFKVKLTPSFKNPDKTAKAFDDSIIKALKDFKNTSSDNDYLFEIEDDNKNFKTIEDEILYPLLESDTPELTNNKVNFYFYLIRNESTRLINNLYKLSNLGISEKEKKYYLTNAITKINSLLKDNQGQRILISKNSKINSDKTNDYILSLLNNTLIKLHLECKELFETWLGNNIYNEAGIYENILITDPPQKSIIKYTAGLNHFKVTQYINKEKPNKSKTLDAINNTLESINTNFPEQILTKEEVKRKHSLLLNLQALENLYFIQLYKIELEDINYDKLLDTETEETIFNESWQKISESIEEYTMPNKRINVIDKELKKLSFLNCDIIQSEQNYLQSIPRKLNEFLNAAKTFTNANLTIDFSKLTEGKTPPLKMNLSVPELAFLFKMLHELKPNIFDVKSEAELLRFIAANFSTKKSKAEGISTDKLRQLFNQPDSKSAELWFKHFNTLFTESKKLK